MAKVLSFIKDLVAVPKCALCNERLLPYPFAGEGDCFCLSCISKWETSKSELCPVCGCRASACRCVPQNVEDFQAVLPALCFYGSDKSRAGDRLLLSMKERKNMRLFRRLARELAPFVLSAMEKHRIGRETCIFTWIPRTKKALSKYGFDQGELLCRCLAEELGCKRLSLFFRIKGREQKKLTAEQRRENAKGTIQLRPLIGVEGEKRAHEDFLEGKQIVIIDDIITTGATVKRGASLLFEAGAHRVLCASVGRVRLDKIKKKDG